MRIGVETLKVLLSHGDAQAQGLAHRVLPGGYGITLMGKVKADKVRVYANSISHGRVDHVWLSMEGG